MTQIYEALADAFAAEGVRQIFCLTGDGNMHWEAAMIARHGAESIHVRHEHAACAMATAYARATGGVGVASVTCGPGLTQIMTALATAYQARIPLVVFAGEDPMSATWYNQRIDQGPLVRATGSAYVAARSAKVINASVLEAFTIARSENRPVVLAVPLDLQKEIAMSGEYVPVTRNGYQSPQTPHEDQVLSALTRIRTSERIVVLAGRGAKAAREHCIHLAEMTGGALATTLLAKGMFHGHHSDIGVAGGYAHEATREALMRADLVIAVGASLSQYTSDQNLLFKPVSVLQIDNDPLRFNQGQAPAGQVILADAEETLRILVGAIAEDPPRAIQSDWDPKLFADRVNSSPADSAIFSLDDDFLDPRDVAASLSKYCDPSWAHVSSSGHCSYFATHITGRGPEDFLAIREFGAIGNGLSYAVGRWAAKPDQPVMLTEGDGGFMMHVQELETVLRHKMKILICLFNDGAYGSEIHKLRADGVSDKGALYGRGDIAAIARGFGLRGHRVSRLDQVPDLARDFKNSEVPTLWDFQVSDAVIAPTMRRATAKA
jgi:acetolactate synthase-1/2/3 large subunit